MLTANISWAVTQLECDMFILCSVVCVVESAEVDSIYLSKGTVRRVVNEQGV